MLHYLTKLLEPKPNGPEMAILLTSLLNVKVSDTTLTKEIEEHPDYPSLLSISDVLNTYGIENLGIKFDYNRFADIPVPFLTQLEGVKSDIIFFTVVKEIKENIIHFFDPEKHRWTKLTKNDFLKRCSRIVLLAEAGEDAGERDYIKKRKGEKRKNNGYYLIALCIPAIVVIAGIMTFVQHGTSALLPSVFSFLTLAGAYVSALLLLYELDQHNPILQQICSASKKVNCGAVLLSKGAKIAGISWSTIGFSYFMGILLLLLFSGLSNPVALFTVSWINSIALSYVIFSIYYQWHIARQWCVLCICVQGLLILQFITTLISGWHQLSTFSLMANELFLPIITAFAVPFVVTVILLPALQKAKENKRNYTEVQKLKHNRQVFETLLQKQKQLTEDPNGLGIFLGNPNAAFKLIKVCNPYCGPCAKAHTPMEELLQNNPDVQIQVLFTASNKEGDIKTPPVKHLLAIAEKNNEPILKRALDDWYLAEKKDYNAFAAKYPLNGELKQQEAKIEAMKNWCDKTMIAFTPMFFLSIPGDKGQASYYQLPDIYTVADLKYFFSV